MCSSDLDSAPSGWGHDQGARGAAGAAAPTAATVTGTTAATAAAAKTITLHAPAGGVSSGAKVFTCTGGLAANPAAGAVTFNAVSTKSTTPLTSQVGYTTVAPGTLQLTVAPASLDAYVTPASVVFTVTFTHALSAGDTVSIAKGTTSYALWKVGGAAPLCAVTSEATAIGAGGKIGRASCRERV